jgi:hypothetical protein
LDNTLCDGWVTIAILSELNADGTINITGAIVMSNSFPSVPRSLFWNASADVDGGSVVNILGASIMVRDFMKSSAYKCHSIFW